MGHIDFDYSSFLYSRVKLASKTSCLVMQFQSCAGGRLACECWDPTLGLWKPGRMRAHFIPE